MSQHRAPRRRAERRRADTTAPSRSSALGHRGAHRAGSTPEPDSVIARSRRFPRPSAFLVTGASALVVAAAGATSLGSAQAAHNPAQQPAVQALSATITSEPGTEVVARGRTPGHDGLGSHLGRDGRPATISRNAGRVALDRAQQQQLEKAAERQAAARSEELSELASLAEDRAREIEASLWVLPVSGYDITATFGAGGGLWSSDHTGTDFAADYGTPVVSVAHGVVTGAGYAGAYGNRVIVTHDDGTETWYCHLADLGVSRGQEVAPGATVGRIGMTGNTTGPHLHFEVRPDPNVPIDPEGALLAHGLRP